jgi:cytochrome P450
MYLSVIIQLFRPPAETLRKYPPLNFLNRECNTTYPLPGSDLVIERGVHAIVSVLGIHHDPEFYPDPDRFDPERFSKDKRTGRNPYMYMPFGTGPRNCIGEWPWHKWLGGNPTSSKPLEPRLGDC